MPLGDGNALSALHAIKNFRQASLGLATSGQPQREHFVAMADAGYVAVINLALHDDPKYSLPDEPEDVRGAKMDYVHIPVQFAHPTLDNLRDFMDAMDAYRHRKVWVHCAANMRVTAFVGLYRVLRQGWISESAFELMQSVWTPNEVWATFIRDALDSRS